ncbi:hypothetical protein F511_20074 [Dorcoceras hygrometricum]|uniref:Uncharacterized protein n=1 Tax=Dorcoceras hygrometricum TaxID=472368 RepID=A0A2Z7BTK9_9LAMI|nr:hypothetical protein F511_20074 [Dorcoceras hygrometricum]
MTFRAVRTNRYNQDLGLIHSTNGNHLESPNEGLQIAFFYSLLRNSAKLTVQSSSSTVLVCYSIRFSSDLVQLQYWISSGSTTVSDLVQLTAAQLIRLYYRILIRTGSAAVLDLVWFNYSIRSGLAIVSDLVQLTATQLIRLYVRPAHLN